MVCLGCTSLVGQVARTSLAAVLLCHAITCSSTKEAQVGWSLHRSAEAMCHTGTSASVNSHFSHVLYQSQCQALVV